MPKFLSFVLACTSLYAQTFTGTISGVVSDAGGANVAKATVSVTNESTRELRTSETNADGRYTFSQLAPGSYTLKVTQTGFREYVAKSIVLQQSQSLESNVALTVGQVTESVEVTADVRGIDTQTANQMATLTGQTVVELPAVARNPLVFFHSQAGVVAARTGISGSTTDQNQNRFSINGGRGQSVLVTVDGISIAAGDWGGAIATPSVDAVAEFQMVRNAYDASFGRTAGGVIQMSTRGGGQQYHFTAWEYLRNYKLDANSFFNNRNGVQKFPFRRNTFGGNLGGPIWKAKNLYGFFNSDFLRESSPATRITTLPTALERQGDFTQSFNANGTPVPVYDPLTTRADPANPGRFLRDPFSGNRIPSTRFDPVATNVLSLLPNPTFDGRGPARLDNFIAGGLRSKFESNRYDGRVDWVRSQKHSIFGRFTKSPQSGTPALVFPSVIENSRIAETPRWTTALGNTFILNPTTVISVLVGAGKFTEFVYPVSNPSDVTKLGFPAALASQFDVPQTPQFQLSGYYVPGSQAFSRATRASLTYGVHASKQFSRHSLKAGVNIDKYFLGLTETTSGNFAFDRFFTAGPDPDVRGNINSGNTIASFLLGTGAGGNAPRNARPTSTHAHWGFYVHDQWNVSRRLSLNMGLRYEIQRGRTERYNQLNYFDFNAPSPLAQAAGIPSLKGGLVWVDDQNRAQWNAPRTDFAPRFGFAYKLTDKLVARGGYGIYFAPTVNVGPVGNDGYSLDNQWVNSLDNGRTPTNLLRNPFPQGLAQATGRSAGLATAAGFSIRSFQRDRPTPYMQQFSLDVQYEFAGWVAEVGYAGSQGRKLSFGYNGFYAGMNINQIPDSALALGNSLNDQVPNPFFGTITQGPLASRTVLRRQLLRPYPQFQDVSILDMPGATSSFNAVLMRLNRRFSNGMTVLVSYQRSHAEDNASENQGWEVNDRARNVYNLAQERSVSAHDVPNSFALTYVYELPVGRGKKFATNLPKALDAIAGGWQMSAIFKVDSGLPLIFSAPNNVFNFNQWQFPNVTPGVELVPANRTIDRWFNTAAFTQPAPFTYGNAPRFIDEIRYSRVNNWDMALAKNFSFTERLKLQFRSEMYNALNRVQFGRADTNFGGNNFGRVTGTAPGNGPRTIQMALRLSF